MRSSKVLEKILELGNKELIDLWMKNLEQKEINGIVRIACRVSTPEILKYLLLKFPKVDPSANDQEAIRNIYERKSPEILQILLSDKRGLRVLFYFYLFI